MKSETKHRCLLLLLDPVSPKGIDVRAWLTNKGLVAWRANDFSHAIEELSDFTVKNRPDVVMLEVTPVFECLETLRASLCSPGDDTDVSVVALSNKRAPRCSAKFSAMNLDQLETIISREAGPMPC